METMTRVESATGKQKRAAETISYSTLAQHYIDKEISQTQMRAKEDDLIRSIRRLVGADNIR